MGCVTNALGRRHLGLAFIGALCWPGCTSGEVGEAEQDPGGSAGEERAAGSGGASSFGGQVPWAAWDAGADSGIRVRPRPSCASTVQAAQRVQVDLYLMLDRSGSMLDATAAGPTKWDAVGEALTAFANDPQSNGLAVGLQYFPLAKAGVVESCVTDLECMGEGPCLNRACLPVGADDVFRPCLDDDECPGSSCEPFGECSEDPGLVCFNIGDNGCVFSGAGDCVLARSECQGYVSCEVDDYASPAVPLGLLPEQGDPLLSSLRRTDPISRTPTAAALSGALDYAGAQAELEPTHQVVTVLVTDGVPTECEPTDPAALAELITASREGANPVLTYVVGVFAPDDAAGQANSDLWAAAGGTDQALLVDPEGDVSSQFLDALEQVRTGSDAPCAFELPEPPEDETLDFGFVNVSLVRDDEDSVDLDYVDNVRGCSDVAYGWHYNVNPEGERTPTRIELCEPACNELTVRAGRSLEIYLGCESRGPE